MTMKYCDKWIKNLRCERDLITALGWIRDDARCKNDSAANAYETALYYITTGRISGECSKTIRQNIRAVCKWLNGAGDKSYDEIGSYLKTYCPIE